MKKYIKYTSALVLLAMTATGCNDFLDTMPDNRATLDSEKKIAAMLTSGYFKNDYVVVSELASDNTDDLGANNPYTTPFFDQCYWWIDETESNNESLERFWSSCYIAIATCNEALDAIDNVEQTAFIEECRGEALVCRAYNHFMLACMFCQPWSKDAGSHLGLPYMETPETELAPKYKRGNLADFYNKIQADLEEGLKYIGDSHLSVPKYHFNTKAALAFATRFYCYTEQWEKAVDAATQCLGSQPLSMLRDWQATLVTRNETALGNMYIDASSNANLLLMTAYSVMGIMWTNSGATSGTTRRYTHTHYLANNEDFMAPQIYGPYSMLVQQPHVYNAAAGNRALFMKHVNMFEYTDPVAGTGFRRSVYPVLTSDECLLNRAEALIMLRRMDEAAADLTTWMQNITKSKMVLTPASIVAFYKNIGYCYEDESKMGSTIKKHLHPVFTIDGEGSEQECMLQCMLGFRRIETLHAGLRWFDVKRYGMEIQRRSYDAAGIPEKVNDFLAVDDLRRAHQIPRKVIDAGFEANPRKGDKSPENLD